MTLVSFHNISIFIQYQFNERPPAPITRHTTIENMINT